MEEANSWVCRAEGSLEDGLGLPGGTLVPEEMRRKRRRVRAGDTSSVIPRADQLRFRTAPAGGSHHHHQCSVGANPEEPGKGVPCEWVVGAHKVWAHVAGHLETRLFCGTEGQKVWCTARGQEWDPSAA